MKKGRKPTFTAKQVQRMRDMLLEGLNQKEIARIMGVGSSTISSYLRGETKPCSQ